jgi:hypothetical protein
VPSPGNTRVIYGAIQSAKGAPAAAPTHKFSVNGDSAGNPSREIIQLPETDSSAQRADNVVVGSSPGLAWSNWVRGSEFAFLAKGIQGANADGGAGPYTHTATPTLAMPYYTFWDVVPGVQCTRFDDCRFNTLGVSGQALAGIAYSVSIVGLSATLGVTEPVAPAAQATDIKYSYPMVAVTIGGTTPGTFNSFALNINRNVNLLRADNGLAIYDSVPGIYEVEGTFEKIYLTDADYRKMHGGAAAATVLTTTIFSESLSLLLAASAGANQIVFTSSALEYTETTVPVNTDGAPIIQSLSFNTKRQAVWANNLTVVTTNSLATTATSPT